ncbi:dynein axonemal heavy chain 3 [Condylostylus longicornis]|uniref:dynein axonemal heavy chain 3 n=1 Tax=Condylostylus longicornis TaxID=2530218 RepID=UPI00244DBE51|nr:dynein axonemal heavy chain 3 [Condylostylus longicornis]
MDPLRSLIEDALELQRKRYPSYKDLELEQFKYAENFEDLMNEDGEDNDIMIEIKEAFIDKKFINKTKMEIESLQSTKKIIQPKIEKKKQTTKEIMMELVQKDREQFIYLQTIQPKLPSEQRNTVLKRYYRELDRTLRDFSALSGRKMHFIMQNVKKIENYPSRLFMNIIQRLAEDFKIFKKAHAFIEKEKVLFPNVLSETMLINYIFDIPNNVPRSQAILIAVTLIDLQEDYRYEVKRALLRYILKSPYQRKLLCLEEEPPEFPRITIKAPIPWKVNIQIAINRLDQVLMVTHPALTALNVLWFQFYNDMVIVDTNKFYEKPIPLNADEILALVRQSCLLARDILINDWLPRCADLLDAMKKTWKEYIPMNSKYGGRAAIFFNCIHALMSLQLQGLIKRNLDQFYNVLKVYKDGNLMDKYDFMNPKLIRNPLMTIVVSIVGRHFIKTDDLEESTSEIYKFDADDPKLFDSGLNEKEPVTMEFSTEFIMKNSGKMFVYPYMCELPKFFVNIFRSILRVGYYVPRLEFLMSQREDQLGYLFCIHESHSDMEELYKSICDIIEANWIGPRIYLYPIYTYYFPLLSGKMIAMMQNVFTQRNIPSLQTFQLLMTRLRELLEEIYMLIDFTPMNLFMIDTRHVNKTLDMLVNDIINYITNYFKILNRNENKRICNELEDMSMKAGERPEETVEVVALQNYLMECRDEKIYKIKEDIAVALKRVIFLLYYSTMSHDDLHLNTRTFLLPAELEKVLDLSASRLLVVRENLEVLIREKRLKFEKYVLTEKKRIDAFRLKEVRDILTIEELRERVETVNELFEILENCSKEAKSINVEEELLQLEVTQFPVLADLIEKLEPIEKLWKTAFEFENSYEIWMYGPFENLNADAIRESVDSMYKIIFKLTRQLVSNPLAKRAAEQVRMKIDKFRVYLPVLDSICRQGLEERHWNQISDTLGKPINPELYNSAKDMIDADIMTILPELETISNAAGKEFELNNQLIAMQLEWKQVKFDLLQYRDSDTFILASIDDIQTLLDDQVLKSQAMRRSPFIAALGTKADDWEEKLVSMQDIIDSWITVQSTWMYLEPIFSSEDIMRQMPIEGRNFKAVDKLWRKIMKSTSTNPNVIEATDYPDLVEIFRKAVIDLECVQKGLNSYLEQKRLFFARFFFLSNDELLEILSETKDPMRVQPHMKKCFEGIYALNFDENQEITAIISSEDEVVKLQKKVSPAIANGLVEIWLKELEMVMTETIHERLKQAWEDYFAIERIRWVLTWPGQIVQAIACTAWTSETGEAIEANKISEYVDKCATQIDELVGLVRNPLSSGQRITIEALIILDVHARDVTKNLADENISSLIEFDWISQLRYSWKQESKIDYLTVSMVVTDIRYALEYLGNISRLVVTPLTDRCYRTLMGALKLCLGGAPEGPAGTGKTETCKDLAKAVAKKCVVFNCSEGLDYKALGKFFKGLAQSGAWACFDEFNRIELEVLSVVAQQILTLQRAIGRKLVKFYFEDAYLKLDPTCACFITMNPGYAGRTELPDNLKVLFRTVAMMVPDYAMIGEITLYSNGFNNARPLAQKIVQAYKLCSEQLSSQTHYDYGMRAVKSVLLASAALRRIHQNLPEEKIVLRAIVDVNLPKFLEQDVSLFKGIYMDLFPEIELPEPSREDMVKWIKKILEDKNLQATEWYVEKILQIYEMLLVRHGLMIIGGPMAGKTTAYQTLANVLRSLSKDNESTQKELYTNYRIINPKAITLGQLYGCFDSVSHEWSDGVLAKTFRDFANGSKTERYWVMFDGPVDAIWIESLNTVLDDNKILCLMSGEIIQMSKTMNMMFEPADLDQASPATVSRCGMIYMEPDMLGWKALHHSFMKVLEKYEGLNDIYFNLYTDIVEWIIPAALNVLKECKAMLETSSLYQYKMLTILFSHFLDKQTSYNQVWFQQTFIFCFGWAYGSALTVEGHTHFDMRIRKILTGKDEDYPKSKYYSLNKGQLWPEKLLYIDYKFDENENWWPWQKSEEINFPENAELSELIVPTKETGYILYWLEFCIEKEISMLLSGPTGTGKSCTISNYIYNLSKNSYMINTINLSARTSAQQVQETIMTKLDRRRKGAFGPPVGKKFIIFCDDLAMPSKDTYGAQPPLELIRTWLDHGYWSDLKDTTKLELLDLQFVGAMGQLGGSNFIFPRFYRHTFTIAVDTFKDTTINRIFTVLGEWHFSKKYSEKIQYLLKGLADALVKTYCMALSVFLPTPLKSHYTFSLRDVTRVFQGMIMVPPKRLSDADKFARLWCHETYRVYYDRLIDENDREELLNIVRKTCKENLRFSLEQIFGKRIPSGETVTTDHIRNLFFGNYMEPDADPKIYDEVESYEKLEKVMHFYLQDYNTFSNTPMDLVLFRFAIEHISRVTRVLTMKRGNILMVGVGGSGRRSSVKLAANICDAKLLTVNITKSYTTNDWRDDIKNTLMHAGFNLKPTIFMFSDTQATDEGFIEDINAILNTGDLPNLYQADEKATIMENMTTVAKQLDKKLDGTPTEVFGFYIEQIKDQLHFALAFTPIGEAFKERLRMFPSLVNCCTIDWFIAWPHDALVRVAEYFIGSMNLNKEEEEEEEKENPVIQDESAQVDDSKTTGTIENIQEIILSDLEKALVESVIFFNVSITEASEKCFSELGRQNYVTPTSYLQMLLSFKSFYIKKYDEIVQLRDRYTIGLEKLDFAASQVTEMQENLYKLQPQLKILSEETDKIMVNIERETAEAEKKKEVVGADEAAANEAAAAAQAIKDDCESDLAEAIPALESALDALNTLKPADIVVVKSMKNPPYAVKLVLEAVCVIKGIKPDRKPDATGRMGEDYWTPSQKMLGDMKFLENLKTFDKDNIPQANIKKIREKYIPDRDFIPDKIKSASTACEGLCRWVRAMDVYDKVAKIVAPKKLALAEAETELQAQMEKLNAKRAELQDVLDKLQKLNDYFAEKSREKKGLEDEIDNCEKKLNRAEKLLGGLGGEKTRWSESANRLHKSLHNVVGDVLLAAGCIAYLGFFPTEYRANIINCWNQLCIEKEIPCSEKFSLITTLGHPMKIRAWSLAGLPADNFSVENAIIVANSNRYPLMIDPQEQANKWIKTMEKVNNIQVVKLTDDNYMKVLESSMELGTPVLIENVGEKLDPNLSPILEKNVIKQKGAFYIKCGENLLDYNHNFRLYITTCLRNPHYSPETMVMVTIINFMITEQGLREQLLATVVAHERPDLQEKKEQLIVESAANRDALYNIESKILEVLSCSEGNVLEDENAINILSSSKVLSEEIQEKQIIAIETEKEIDSARLQYIPVSNHSAILFFCISELAGINPMYQYSLAWFQNLFVNTILKAPKSDDLQLRLQNLNDYFTKSIYQNVCRSLFEQDKLVISFVMCTGILLSRNKIDKEHFIFLLTGGRVFENPNKNPAPQWLSEKSWLEIVQASTLKGLENLHIHFSENIDEWKKLYESTTPEELKFPAPFTDVDQLMGLILLKCIRPDKIIPAARRFITMNMDKSFVEPPPFDLHSSFAESSPTVPLVFLLSSGSDPMASLIMYAKQRDMYDKTKLISLGQGQGPRAEKMIYEGAKAGEWVVLQNCHVAESWMNELERICNDSSLANAHADYRLWCTSYPSKVFPVSVLQNSVKMTNESPKGLKMNMLRSYNSDPLVRDKFFSNAFSGDMAKYWLRGVFALVFFHAVIQERREFGHLGWNIPYEFNESDLKISLMQLKMFIKQTETIPFRGHVYLTGECNYGGRVTDDKDRRLILCLLNNVYNQNSIDVDEFCLSDSGDYKIPLVPNRLNSIEYISNFPLSPNPEVFGLHENADISKNTKETRTLLDGVLLTQTSLLASTKTSIGKEREVIDPIYQLCTNILDRLPDTFNIRDISLKYPVVYNNSMNTILRQELIRFNKLLDYIRKSLVNVQKAIQGKIAMVPELERTYNSINVGKLPADWLKKSYPSLKPLGSYINDLITRLSFFQNWVDNGAPDIFWISGFYFTQSFLTGILQNHARRNKFQIDLVGIRFEVMPGDDVGESDEYSTFVKGLFLEGARWNRELMHLDESLPKILFDIIPVIKLIPDLRSSERMRKNDKQYECPIYKTSERKGTLSTTGHSTNFVMYIQLDTVVKPEHWIIRGTASLCQLDD